MSKFESFTNQYSLNKTLRFSLIPVGKTEENFNAKLLLEEDETRAKEYSKVKRLIDRYHRHYIEGVLSTLVLDGVSEYADLYYKTGKTEKDLKDMEKAETTMRKSLSKALTSTSVYKKLFSKELITEILPEFLSDENELASVEMFQSFSTYFVGFNDNRRNMYTELPQATAISYRCVNENLPKFLDNAANFKKIITAIPEKISLLNEDVSGLYGVLAEDVFSVDYFSFVLAQSGIDKYNEIIGGYTCSDGTKVQGLNEYVNLYNQQVAGKDRSLKLPFMKPLYKQIITLSESVSFIPAKFESDDELLSAVARFCSETVDPTLNELKKLADELETFDTDGIHIRSGASVTDISNAVFGKWNVISEGWRKNYAEEHPLKTGKSEEKYAEDMSKAYKAIKSFSIRELEHFAALCPEEHEQKDILTYLSAAVAEKISFVTENYAAAEKLLTESYAENNDKKLCRNDAAIEKVKNLLDSIKDIEWLLKPLLGTGKEENKDDTFYGRFLPLFESLSELDKLYDKVRNYVTQKPYSKDKIKLNFQNPQLLGGWDRNKERDYRTVLLKKDDKYYLAVMDKSNSKAFVAPPAVSDVDTYEKIEYKLLPGPNKMLPKVFFAASNIEYYNPDKHILDIRKKESFKKGDSFDLKDCHDFIDFFKASIAKHEDWSQFGFKFSDTASYKDISEFYKEVSQQGYSINYRKVDASYINDLVDSGHLYLFQIYNKDFSPHSHGKENLHTMYFKMLFDERNLADVVYQLNGGAEMFCRKASIKDGEKIVHPANMPVKNKNSLNEKKESVFDFDLVKDRRFTKRQFSLHLPITLNFKSEGREFINHDVRLALKNSDDNYVIGIDRGERNLLYVCVINGKGEIVWQQSLNEIISDNSYTVDYHKLLDDKEKARDAARKSWGTVENIKELKEGYLSQVVHKICELAIKYDAVIALEDLNFGFKNGRFKVEKQVYQKFENMLISKLNYLVDKSRAADEAGGLLNAYQLTNKVDGVNRGRQNGIIFYVPAWLTSKLDPTTGFADLIRPGYTSIAETKSFIRRIDDIRYNSSEDLFEFDFDLEKFPNTAASYKKKWTVCTNGERIKTFRNENKNGEWDNETVLLSEAFKDLFSEHHVDISEDIKSQLLSVDGASFFARFMKLLALTLQMRNSITGSDVDYLISPVRNASGSFFDSRNLDPALPENADANGAYNIARKALWAIDLLKKTPDDELQRADLFIRKADWLELAQK